MLYNMYMLCIMSYNKASVHWFRQFYSHGCAPTIAWGFRIWVLYNRCYITPLSCYKTPLIYHITPLHNRVLYNTCYITPPGMLYNTQGVLYNIKCSITSCYIIGRGGYITWPNLPDGHPRHKKSECKMWICRIDKGISHRYLVSSQWIYMHKSEMT
jgi:hypothetical protein